VDPLVPEGTCDADAKDEEEVEGVRPGWLFADSEPRRNTVSLLPSSMNVNAESQKPGLLARVPLAYQ
jgi:hypothetical protein